MLFSKSLVLGVASAGVASSMVLPTLPRLEQYHLLNEPFLPQLARLFSPPRLYWPSWYQEEEKKPELYKPSKEDGEKTELHNSPKQSLEEHKITNIPQAKPTTPEEYTTSSSSINHYSYRPSSDGQCTFSSSSHTSHGHFTPHSIISPLTWGPLSHLLLETTSNMLTTPTHRRRNLMETIHLGFSLEDRSLENVYLGVTYTRHSERRPMPARDEREEGDMMQDEREILWCLGEATRGLGRPGKGMMEGGWEVPDGRGRVSFLIWRID